MLADDLWVLRRRRKQQSRKGSAAAMTRQPTGSDAGADNGDPPVAAAGPRQRLAHPVGDLRWRSSTATVDGLSLRRFSNAVGRDPVMLYRPRPQ
jgi:hypothetical protein